MNYISCKKIYKLCNILLYVILFLSNNISNGLNNNLEKRVELFKSYIKINKDRSINIKEQITYFLPIAQHGIKVFFPVFYKDKLGNDYKILFKVSSILRDNKPECYTITNFGIFKLITIGDPNKLISGSHVYDINYTTNDQLGFFDKWDELSFPAIPGEHKVYIENATVEVELPKDINKEGVRFEAYFGTQDPKNENYIASINDQNIIKFKLTKALPPGEKFQVVIGWPKGYIKPKTNFEEFEEFLLNNLYIIILLFGLTLLCAYYFIKISQFKSQIIKRSIIPLFYPPDNMLPSAVGCLYNYGFNSTTMNKLFAAEIVNMAVHNLLTINYKKGSFLSAGTYTLVKNKDLDNRLDKEDISKEHRVIFNMLFSKSDSIKISVQDGYIIRTALQNLSDYLHIYYVNKYFDYHSSTTLKAIFFSSLIILISAYFNFTIITIACIIIYIIAIAIFAYLSSGYTQEGQKLVEDIKGFRRFLSVTESERLKVIGTPPEKTPELFEKYLPYAMALGVEKAWSKKFASVFNQIKDYKPAWTNVNLDTLSNINFYSNLSNVLRSSIVPTSAKISNLSIPGSTSGFEDKGRSSGSGGGFDTW